MKYLRTVSTHRLLATIAGMLAVIAAGTAIAVAASGGGPVPPAKQLAPAIHDALSAPSVAGITARITFTNHLIESSNIQGSDPILTGATGRLWLAPGHVRLELQSDSGEDAQIVLDNGSLWVYDPTSDTVYTGTVGSHRDSAHRRDTKHGRIPTIAEIQRELTKLAKHLNVSGAIPGDVAGQPTYSVRVTPKHDGGLLGAAELGWDAVHGVPLRIAVYASGNPSPVLELKATSIAYGAVPMSDFAISPPAGAKVVKVASANREGKRSSHRQALRTARKEARITNVAAIARQLPFRLDAPAKLAGLPRRSVTLLDWGGSKAALVLYGQNLGGVAVVERAASSGAHSQARSSGSSNGDHNGLSLPTVSINGATGQELDTALGTAVQFTRTGVSYLVVGSVPPVAAEAAARGL